MVRIAVTGPNGRLGSELIKRGCLPLNADVTDAKAVEREIKSVKPDVIINCAVKSDVDGCENDQIKTYAVNTFAPEVIAKSFGGYFIQISTDFVFDGKFGPYDESDTPFPIQTYGMSKYMAETLVAGTYKQSLIIRTTNLYDAGKAKDNFALWVIRQLRSGQKLSVSDDQFGNPTYVPHLAEGILAAINQQAIGVLNIVGDLVCSRYEFAQHLARGFGFNVDLIGVGYHKPKAKRPKYAGLKTDKAKALKIPIYDVHVGIEELRQELNLHE